MRIIPVIGYSVGDRTQTQVLCPFCGCLHYHGGGVGTRVPHCVELTDDEYDIIEIRNEPMPKDLVKLGKANERRMWSAKRSGRGYTPRWPGGHQQAPTTLITEEGTA